MTPPTRPAHPLTLAPSLLSSVLFIQQYAGKELSAEQVQATVEELKKVVEASRERRKDRMARKATEDFDEEEEEALEEENEQEDEVIDQVSCWIQVFCSLTAFKSFGVFFYCSFSEIAWAHKRVWHDIVPISLSGGSSEGKSPDELFREWRIGDVGTRSSGRSNKHHDAEPTSHLILRRRTASPQVAST